MVAIESDSQRTPAAGTVNGCVTDQRTQNSENWNNCCFSHRIGEVRKFLASKGVGLDDACTDAAGRTCWLCRNTTPWNRLLAPLSLELAMSGPGELALRSINVDNKDLEDDNARYDGVFVFSWLPKQHRCVQTICLQHNFISQIPAYSLKLALGSSANLRHLKLQGGSKLFKADRKVSEGLESLATLASCEFLKLDVTPVLASSIAALLRRNKGHLVKVGFEDNELSQRSTATLLSALIGCKALTELSFDRNVLNRRNVKAMGRVVRAARLLKKLSLRWSRGWRLGDYCGPIAAALKDHTSLEELRLTVYQTPLVPVFEALETNTTLRHLDLFRCFMLAPNITGLANLLRRNKALRGVELRRCHVYNAEAAELANAIVENSTLETLDMSGNEVGIQGVAAFCAALEKNKTLKTVFLGMSKATEGERRGLADLLNRSECYGRVVVPWANPDLPPLTMALSLAPQSPSVLRLRILRELSTALVCELFYALGSNTTVKRLEVVGLYHKYDEADALCQALTTNQSIKTLEVDVNGCQESFVSSISKALIRNAVVTELIIYSRDIELCSSQYLAGMLTQNKTLTTIVLHCGCLRIGPLNVLSQGMAQNRVVTSFATVEAPLPRNRAAFRLNQAVRRNTTLLNMAAQFVLQADVTKHCAQAFETLRWTSSLVSQVAKVSGQSEQEAAAAVDLADGFIRSRFLFVTGVVKDAVRCFPGTGTQADALNDDCWQAIAEYLKVSDVRDG
ncbi:uncharacterized protein LOC144157966 [Haemaphysalis longicornis]